MTNFTANILKYAGLAALAIVIIVGVKVYSIGAPQVAFGAVGGQLLEDVMPYVRANGGINTAYPIQTSSTITSSGGIFTGAVTFLGNIIQAGANTLVAVFPGTVILNNLIQSSGGYSNTYTTTAAVTVAQWCAGTSIQIASSTAAAFTLTLPAASSTYATCGAATGSWSDQIIDNESSYNITLATTTGGNGIRFFDATGTPATGITYPPFIAASSTVRFTGQYISTSTLNAYMLTYSRPYGNGS